MLKADIVMCSVADPAAYVDYYADSYSTDDSLSFYFIFLTENSVEISGTDNAVCVLALASTCANYHFFACLVMCEYVCMNVHVCVNMLIVFRCVYVCVYIYIYISIT